ncbi:broad substrate specificity ATP-binding cassette transporter ABCG2-like [Mytilus californianus]|uniref:broad substrate specificity ATP-binding cassette transporter ABCG2-like n=1 Tax=Mytilus californianus TaxID=6549 RepID=UPI002247236B|nr:broad substrate specificity ATP-binding cassette transporter ABCG2-like [Mytilus californianus]
MKTKTCVVNPVFINDCNNARVKIHVKAFEHKQSTTISCHDIIYRVDVKTKLCPRKIETREILKGIDGVFKAGMNAILGPTGCGKSSLLDILAGRKEPLRVTGDLLFNGSPPPENFKCMVGYVVQDDVVMGGLTVRENFAFSAALRLPGHITKADIQEKIQNVINELGLTDCADTKVGNELFRGISGGERKRTNIGMELITSPPVLFLDEPTTGLDANTAHSVMQLLKSLSKNGTTVVFSIHQPRFSIFKLFDSLMMLSLGECVYHGPAHESLDYLRSIGYIIEEHNNPPDFFLDVINGAAVNTLDENNVDVHQKIVSSFRKSILNSRLQNVIKPILHQYHQACDTNTLNMSPKVEYATSFLKQFRVISSRNLLNLLRNPQLSILHWIVLTIFGLIVGAIYWRMDRDCISGIQNRVGAFFFILMNIVFSSLSAVELFIKERSIFIHENLSGFYRVSAYFFSKIICDSLPMRLIPVFLFSVITYFMLGLTLDEEKFFLYALTLFTVAMTGTSIAFFFSACVTDFGMANVWIAVTYVLMMVFSGLLVNIKTIQDWLRWIKWFSLFRYGLNALEIIELKDMTFTNGTVLCSTTGNDYLTSQDIAYETKWDFWQNMVALFSMSVLMFIGTYIQLRRTKKIR